jgi:hypothetical protein
MHPSMNALDRFAAHQPTIDGMHSAGMQPKGGRRFFYRAAHPSGMQYGRRTLHMPPPEHGRCAQRRIASSLRSCQ